MQKCQFKTFNSILENTLNFKNLYTVVKKFVTTCNDINFIHDKNIEINDIRNDVVKY